MTLEDLKILDCFNISIEKKELFLKFASLLKDTNEKFNLTAIVDDQEIAEKHFFDSLVVLQKHKFFSDAKVLDIGTGAGFPGIPLAIVCPDVDFYLLESSSKKCDFIKTVVNELKLNNVIVLNRRAEEIKSDERETFDFVITRAMSEMRMLSELCAPYLKVNGLLIEYKGLNYNIELQKSFSTNKILSMRLLDTYSYHLKQSNQDRYIVSLQKMKKTPLNYPRNYSLIKKKSL